MHGKFRLTGSSGDTDVGRAKPFLPAGMMISPLAMFSPAGRLLLPGLKRGTNFYSVCRFIHFAMFMHSDCVQANWHDGTGKNANGVAFDNLAIKGMPGGGAANNRKGVVRVLCENVGMNRIAIDSSVGGGRQIMCGNQIVYKAAIKSVLQRNFLRRCYGCGGQEINLVRATSGASNPS